MFPIIDGLAERAEARAVEHAEHAVVILRGFLASLTAMDRRARRMARTRDAYGRIRSASDRDWFDATMSAVLAEELRRIDAEGMGLRPFAIEFLDLLEREFRGAGE